MPLLEHQIVLGRCLRAAGTDPLASLQGIRPDRAELAELDDLVHSPGFRFTQRGQRSWCEGRTAEMAQLTLSILSTKQRRQLVDDWVDAGGGAAFDPASEAEAFLEFVAGHLSAPSHAMTVCRMEQATYRASGAALRFTPPDLSLLDQPNALLCAGKGAALVRFFAEPQRLFAAIEAKAPLPPLSDKCFPVLFAPGLPRLVRAANNKETAIWDKLASPIAVRLLSRGRHSRCAIDELFRIGAMDLAPEERLGVVLDRRTACPVSSDGRDQTLNGLPLARGRGIARVC
jgi:hypothetical protein